MRSHIFHSIRSGARQHTQCGRRVKRAASENASDDSGCPATMGTRGTGTRYVFTALRRNEADLENNKASGFYQGTEIAVDQFVAHVIAMK